MTMRNSWPGPTNVTSTTDARIDLSGLLEGTTAGVARAGLFPTSLAAIVTARADMNVNVAAFQGVAVQFGGPVLIANDGTMQLPAVLVSPASGVNYYITFAKQNEQTAPGTDANNLPVLGATLSTVSFAAARASLPTGALELATVQVPAGVSATNAGGVTITQTAQYTAAEGGTVPVRNSTDEAGWTPADGSSAFRMDTAQFRDRLGGSWVTRGATCTVRTSTAQSTSGSALAPQAMTWNVEDLDTDNFHDNVTNPSRLIAPAKGIYRVTGKVRTASTSFAGGVQLGVNGTVDAASRLLAPPYSGSGIGAFAQVTRTYQLNAGDYVEVFSLGEAAGLTITIAECFAEITKVG